MEEARFWMWPAKPNIGLSSKVVASTKSSAYGDSWEEQAFEEDAAGPLGGCIWPPSSYTCTFCRREFRSAQALGGHMNVHRRDRARLKQSPSTFNNHILIPNSSLEIDQLPSRIGTLVYNKDSDHDQDILNSPTRVLAPIIHEVGQFEGNDISTPWFSSPISTEQQKGSSLLTPLLWSSFTADRYFNIQDTDKLQVKKFDFLDLKCKGKRGCVGTDLSVSLNVSVCEEHNKQDVSSGEEDDYNSFKRRKTDHATVLSFLKHNSVHRNTVSPVSQVLENSSILNEDVDLELRLGARSIYKR